MIRGNRLYQGFRRAGDVNLQVEMKEGIPIEARRCPSFHLRPHDLRQLDIMGLTARFMTTA
jgi:hypothetical protein